MATDTEGNADLAGENIRLSARVALLEGRLRAAKRHECMRCGGEFECPAGGPSATLGCSAGYSVFPPGDLAVHRCPPASDHSAVPQPPSDVQTALADALFALREHLARDRHAPARLMDAADIALRAAGRL